MSARQCDCDPGCRPEGAPRALLHPGIRWSDIVQQIEQDNEEVAE